MDTVRRFVSKSLILGNIQSFYKCGITELQQWHPMHCAVLFLITIPMLNTGKYCPFSNLKPLGATTRFDSPQNDI